MNLTIALYRNGERHVVYTWDAARDWLARHQARVTAIRRGDRYVEMVTS